MGIAFDEATALRKDDHDGRDNHFDYFEPRTICNRACKHKHGELVCEYELTATAMYLSTNGLVETEADCADPNLCRIYLVWNRQFPGPSICTLEGVKTLVKVNNLLEYNFDGQLQRPNLSSHWHGLVQRNNPESDGVPGVSEPGIPFGCSHVYNFTISQEIGFYWYHSHAGLQYADGLLGRLFVVSGPTINPQYYNIKSLTYVAIDGIGAEFSTAVYEPWAVGKRNLPSSVNTFGMGGNVRLQTMPGSRMCGGGQVSDYMVYHVPSCEHRDSSCGLGVLGILNAGSILQFTVSVQYHKFGIFETDGSHVRSLYTNQVSVLEVLIAQRVGLSYNQYPPILGQNSYWIAAVDIGGVTGCAILHYDQKGVEVQVPADWNLTDLSSGSECIAPSETVSCGEANCMGQGACAKKSNCCLEPIFPNQGPLDPNQPINRCNVNVVVTFIPPIPATSKPRAWRLAINTTCYYPDGTVTVVSSGATQYMDPSEVILYVAATQGRDPKNTSWVAANGFTNVAVIPDGFQVFCNISANFGTAMNGPHPWHQHGYDIAWVGGSDGGQAPLELNYENPISRDTIPLWSRGWSIYSFTANNPGAWISHCHIQGHIHLGFGSLRSSKGKARTAKMARMIRTGTITVRCPTSPSKSIIIGIPILMLSQLLCSLV
eukprot:g12249.t1